MKSTNNESGYSSSPTSTEGKTSSSRSSNRNKESTRDSSSKAKERSRRARGSPATTPGAVPSSSSKRPERNKESGSGSKRRSSASVDKSSGGRKSRSSSSAASKPGAVPSRGRDSSKKGSGSSRSINRSKPGAVSSRGRDRSKKGSSSRSINKSSQRPSLKASSGSSTTRSSRVNDEKKEVHHITTPSANEMESGLVAEAVDDTERQTTANALRDKNRQVEALRQELQRRDEEQASESRSRGKPFWGMVCLGSLVLIGAIVWAVVTFAFAGGGEAATPDILIPTDDPTTSDPTEQATTADPTESPTTGPDGQSVFDPPSASTCAKIAQGLPVDGQEDMSMQPVNVMMDTHLVVDLKSGLWLPGLMKNIQQLVMPPIVGCGNTTLDVFTIGNAQVAEPANINALVRGARKLQTNGSPGYTVEFPVNLFMKTNVASYNINDLKQLVEGVFQASTDLLVNAQDENSKTISDIQIVTTIVPATPSPSLQPSINLLTITESPTISPSLEPSMPSKSGATTSPTKLSTPSPTVAPAIGPTVAPTLTPSLGPTLSPTSGPTLAPVPGLTPPPSPLPTPGPTPPPTPPPTPGPTPGPTMTPTTHPSESPSQAPSSTPTIQPSVAPTSKCTRVETALSRFAPFDDNKALALEWLCSVDTWEPPSSATDETSQSLWEERFALAVFYYATNGAGWTNNDAWLTSADICSWTGINGCNGDGSVTNFQLASGSGYGLTGDFPDEMRALTNLEHFDFVYKENLSGGIPSFLTALTKLTYLGLGDTGRTGSIPSELWTLTQLWGLSFYGNYLTGTIPSGCSALTDLTRWYMSFNDLSGSLPDELGSMTQLTELAVDENNLGGTIPPLPSGLTNCALAKDSSGRHYQNRKTEGNCFTDVSNALENCNLSANQCQLEATLSKFAPFDGNKALALEWLKADSWEPPSSATDETSQSLWEERFALAVFYYATNGAGWTNNDAWLTSADTCSWTGINGCNGDGSVTKIELSLGWADA